MKKLIHLLAVVTISSSACKQQNKSTFGFTIGSPSKEWSKNVKDKLSTGLLNAGEMSDTSIHNYKAVFNTDGYAIPVTLELNNGRYNNEELLNIDLSYNVDSIAGVAPNGDTIVVDSKSKFASLLKAIESEYGVSDSSSRKNGSYHWKKKDFNITLTKGYELPSDSLSAPPHIRPTLWVSAVNADQKMRVIKDAMRKSLKPKQMVKLTLLKPIVKRKDGKLEFNITYGVLQRTYNEEYRAIKGIKIDLVYRNGFNDIIYANSNLEVYWGFNLMPGNTLNTNFYSNGMQVLLQSIVSYRNTDYSALVKLLDYSGEIKSEVRIKAVVFEDGEVLND